MLVFCGFFPYASLFLYLIQNNLQPHLTNLLPLYTTLAHDSNEA